MRTGKWTLVIALFIMAVSTKTVFANESLVGNWQGQASQPGFGSYPVELNLTRNPKGQLTGYSIYSSLHCHTSLTLIKEEGNTVSFREKVVQGSGCISNGMIVLSPRNRHSLTWNWHYPDGRSGAVALVYKKPLSTAMNLALGRRQPPGTTRNKTAAIEKPKAGVHPVITLDRSAQFKDAVHIKNIKRGREEIVVVNRKVLLKNEINKPIKKDGSTILHQYAIDGDNINVQFLIEQGANPNVIMNEQLTPLILNSFKDGNAATAEVLLKAGADVKARMNNGWTALHAAANSNQVGIVKVLLRYGADIHARDKHGKTAYQLAQAKGYSQVLAALQDTAVASAHKSSSIRKDGTTSKVIMPSGGKVPADAYFKPPGEIGRAATWKHRTDWTREQRLSGSWRGIFNNQLIEFVFWPYQPTGDFEIDERYEGVVEGYAYFHRGKCFADTGLNKGRLGIVDIKFVPRSGKSCGGVRVDGVGKYTASKDGETLVLDIDHVRSEKVKSGKSQVRLERYPMSPSMENFLLTYRGLRAPVTPKVLTMLRSQVGRLAVIGKQTEDLMREGRTINGLIVRPFDYWARYRSYSVKQVFEGNYPYAKEDPSFYLLYMTYHNWFYKKCNALVPEYSPGYITYQVSTGKVVGEVKVRWKYWYQYQKAKEQTNRYLTRTAITFGADAIRPGRTLRDILRVPGMIGGESMSLIHDLAVLFNTEPCNSGFHAQLADNLLYLSHGYSLQSLTSRQFTYASQDIARPKTKERTIRSACIQYYKYKMSHMGDTALLRWCSCIASGLQGMPHKYRTEVIKKPSLLDEIMAGVYNHDPSKRYMEATQRCRE